MNNEIEIEMPFEINGFEYLCTVFFDYSAYYAGDPAKWGKTGRIDWGTPEEPEEYTINRVTYDEKFTDFENKLIRNTEHDFSWILDNKEMVENIIEYLKNEKEK